MVIDNILAAIMDEMKFHPPMNNIGRGFSFRKKGPGRRHNNANAHFQFYDVDDFGVRTPKYSFATELRLRRAMNLFDRNFAKRYANWRKKNARQ